MRSLEAVVRTLRRFDIRSSAATYVLHAVLAAAIWLAAVQVLARMVPLEGEVQLAALGIPVVLAGTAVAWIVMRPRSELLMQRADLRLGLKERLSTAWERRALAGSMDDLLRRDALQHAERERLGRAFPIRLNRKEAGVLAVVAGVAVALAVLPNPIDQVLAKRQADRASQAKAASTIEEVRNKIAASTKPAPVDPQVQKILSDTQQKIKEAQDPRQALESISPAEQQLRQLSDPQTPARTTTAQNLANALSTTTAGSAAGQALSSSPSRGAQALRDLAAQLKSLSPEQQAQLVKALADAAQHAQDPAMAASLRQASSALSSGDIATAAAALSGLATELDSLQDQQDSDQEIAAAINGLEAARQGLAAQVDSGVAAGSRNATAGASPAAGAGSGSGSGGSGGTGSSGSGSGSGTAARPGERLYVPGQPVPGQFENEPTPLGPGQEVPLTPYTQVVQAYRQAALDATDRSLIPGSQRDLVREYFSRLGEPVAP